MEIRLSVIKAVFLRSKMDLSRAKRIIKLALKKQDVSISKNSEDYSNNLLNEALLHDVVILIIDSRRYQKKFEVIAGRYHVTFLNSTSENCYPKNPLNPVAKQNLLFFL
ncbi:hypothetical protein NQ317_019637 [Molorchus minor]|uniref:Ribosomal protein L22 n=1 Tax=Molorchus minor TaxID=1323400 RepID=A0ABQ9J2R6_9CUCU|nr:hypothetical protein NQ317_019637 [Molorchus minor]